LGYERNYFENLIKDFKFKKIDETINEGGGLKQYLLELQ